MEKPVRFGLLASSALHILPAGIWWIASMHAQTGSRDSVRELTIEVQFRAERSSAKTDAVVAIADGPAAPATTLPTDGGVPIADLTGSKVSASAGTRSPPIDPPYIPAGDLDARPQPDAPVIVPFPDAPLNKPKVSGVLVLYIGADGKVDRIELDRSDLPPAFEKIAIETFMAVRMQPGIKAGKASRARMKVLVEFEAE